MWKSSATLLSFSVAAGMVSEAQPQREGKEVTDEALYRRDALEVL